MRTARGFTLVEVLVTVTLIGIILPVAMRGASITSKLAGTAKRRTEACGLAESKLNEVVITNGWQNGVLGGDFGQDWPDYHWRCQVQAWQNDQVSDNGAGNVTNELDLQVYWQGSSGEQSVTLSTLVYTPGSTPNTPATTGQ